MKTEIGFCNLKQFREKDLEEALNNIDSLIKNNPNENLELNILGKASLLSASKRFDDLRDWLNKHSEVISKYSDFYMYQGEANQATANYKKTITLIDKALKLNNFFIDKLPHDRYSYPELLGQKSANEYKAYCYNMLAESYMMTGKPFVSEKCIHKSLTLKPEDVYALYIHTRNSINLKKYEDAEKSINEIERIDSNDATVNIGRFELFSNMGRNKEAIINFLKYQKNDRKDIIYDSLSDGLLRTCYRSIQENSRKSDGVVDIVQECITETDSQNLAGGMAITLIDYYGDVSKYTKISEKILNLFTIDSSFKQTEKFFKIFKRSKNIVKSNKKLDWIDTKEYIIKINNDNKKFEREEERLKQEYLKSMWIHTQSEGITEKLFEEPMAIVSEPIFFASNKKLAVYVQQKNTYPDIEEAHKCVNPTQLQNLIEKAIASLSIIHVSGKKGLYNKNKEKMTVVDSQNNSYDLKLEKFNYQNEFMNRVIKGDKNNRLGINNNFLDFHEKLLLNMGIENIEYLLHGDAYPSNVLTDGTWVDFEKSKIGDPTLDVAQLLNNHIYRNPEMFYGYIGSLVEISRIADIIIPESEIRLLESTYKKNILFSDLCQLGHMVGIGDVEKAKYYLNESLKNMDGRLKTSFVKYIKSTKQEELKRAL